MGCANGPTLELIPATRNHLSVLQHHNPTIPPPFFGANENDPIGSCGYIADHIVPLSCEVDDVPIADMRPFRIVSRQIEFMAPTYRRPVKYGGGGGS
jgi:hypothetical protein